MICFCIMAALAQLAGVGEAMRTAPAEESAALALWVLCDIELLKLVFSRH